MVMAPPMSASTLFFSLVLYVSFVSMVSGAEETVPPPPESEIKKLAMTPTGGKGDPLSCPPWY